MQLNELSEISLRYKINSKKFTLHKKAYFRDKRIFENVLQFILPTIKDYI